MKWSSAAVAVIATLAPGRAVAGACCAGSMSAVPVRLGECETAAVGVGVAHEAGVGRWDSGGNLAQVSLRESAYVSTLSTAWRWNRKGQLMASLPLRLNQRSLGGESVTGGGIGDAQLTLVWDPIDEQPQQPSRLALPIPVVTVGLRMPTGRDWTASQDPWMADVTGTGHPVAVTGLRMERTLDRWPRGVGVNQELQPTPTGLQGATRLSGSLGRTFGARWTLTTSALHERTWMATSPLGTARTAVGARVIHGRLRAWRAWAGSEVDVPIAGAGNASTRMVRVGTGFVLLLG